MNNIIIVKAENVKQVFSMKAYIEMRLRHGWDKVTCQLVDDAHTCVVFKVRTNKKRFEEIKNELGELYPGTCAYLNKKTEESQP